MIGGVFTPQINNIMLFLILKALISHRLTPVNMSAEGVFAL